MRDEPTEGPDLPVGALVIEPAFGRAVVVPDRALAKIRDDHGAYFMPRRDVILGAVANADGHASDPVEGRHRYWRAGPGGSRWLFVVVDYDRQAVGAVVTAFPRRRLPPMP